MANMPRLKLALAAALTVSFWSRVRASDHDESTLAPMPLGRHMFVAAAIDGRIYCIGGNDRSANTIKPVHVYDVAANAWAVKAAWPAPSAYPCGGAIQGKFYVVGGTSRADKPRSIVHRYDPKTDNWEALADLPLPRSHSVAVALEEKLYVIGGFGAFENPEIGVRGQDLDDVSIFDTRAGGWSTGPRLPRATHGMAAAVIDGHVHVFGGLTEPDLHLALVNGRWLRRAKTPFDVVKMPATGIGTKAIVIGGGPDERDVAVYDATTDKWSMASNSLRPRFLSQATAMGSSIFALGGTEGGGGSQVRIERYDVGKNAWHE